MKTKSKLLLTVSSFMILGLMTGCAGKSADQKLVESYTNKLGFNKTQISGSENLPSKLVAGEKTIAVAWEVNTEKVVISDVDASTGYYTMTPSIPRYGEDKYTFNLTATLTLEKAKTTKVFKDISVFPDQTRIVYCDKVSDVYTKFAAGELKANDLLQVTGVVGIVLKGCVVITDNTSNFMLYGNDFVKNLALGDRVTVKGKLAPFNNLLQISYTDYEIVETVANQPYTLPAATEVSLAEFGGTDWTAKEKCGSFMKPYKLSGLVYKVTEEKTYYYVGDAASGKAVSIYESCTPVDSMTLVKNSLGKKVTGEFILYSQKSSDLAPLVVFNGVEGDLVVSQEALTAKEKVFITKKSLSVDEALTANVTLPTTSEDYSDVTISWESSNTAVIEADGTIHQTNADQNAKLTATITCGEETDKAEFDVTVKGAAPVTLTENLSLDASVAGLATSYKDGSFTSASITFMYNQIMLASNDPYKTLNAFQFSKKSDTRYSNFYSVNPITNMKEVVITYVNTNQTYVTNQLTIYTGTNSSELVALEASAAVAGDVTNYAVGAKTVYEQVVTYTLPEGATFLKFANDGTGGAAYIKSIVINKK